LRLSGRAEAGLLATIKVKARATRKLARSGTASNLFMWFLLYDPREDSNSPIREML
jgi:hypothetical protein